MVEKRIKLWMGYCCPTSKTPTSHKETIKAIAESRLRGKVKVSLWAVLGALDAECRVQSATSRRHFCVALLDFLLLCLLLIPPGIQYSTKISIHHSHNNHNIFHLSLCSVPELMSAKHISLSTITFDCHSSPYLQTLNTLDTLR